MSLQGICMDNKQIKVVKQWPEPKSVKDIQVLLGFVNFYRQFNQSFRRIAAPLTSMLKTTGSVGSTANPKKTENEAGDDSVVGKSMVYGGEAIN